MNIYLVFVLFLLAANWLLDLVVERLNLKHVSTEIPEEFKDVYDAKEYARSQRYLRDNTYFGLIQSTVMLPLTVAFILLGGFRWIYQIAITASDHMILQGLIFVGVLMLISNLVGLPFSLYDTFVIEERYGFNRTTARTFVLDMLKGLMLAVVLGAPVFAMILWIFDTIPYAWFWAWAAVAIVQLTLTFIAPLVILPIFNKFTPLEEGELRDRLYDYATVQQYNLSGIYKIDGSRRSTKSNAYFTGFGKTKRIALFDTLIDKLTIGELVCVLAHEVGHCKRGHIKKRIALSLATSLLMFFLLAQLIRQPGLFEAFGIENTPLYAGFVFFGFIYIPVSILFGIAGNIVSRKHEYEADAFAAQTTGRENDMIGALKKLSLDNLSNLTPHPLKVFLEYSHPPVLERIRALFHKPNLEFKAGSDIIARKQSSAAG